MKLSLEHWYLLFNFFILHILHLVLELSRRCHLFFIFYASFFYLSHFLTSIRINWRFSLKKVGRC